MRKILSALFSCCLVWLAVLVVSVTPAQAGKPPQAGKKVCLCHNPPGNPANAHTICVGAPAVSAHLGHGDTLGECTVLCGGSAGNTCSTSEFCRHREGVCDAEAQGVCADRPSSCSRILSPVCGCDGTTYNNACLAAAAGVNVLHAGECVEEKVCGGAAGAMCGEDEFCKREDGVCAADSEGTCMPLHLHCQAIYAPVCGCDGMTYSNECFADVAGTGVLSTGACAAGTACGGTEGGACQDGEFCKPPLGQCTPGAPGHCAAIPPACPRISSPVCGCDGKTYGNACLADTAGVGVDHPGACAADQTVCGGTAGQACGTGEFCKRPEGACAADAQGVCEDQSPICPAILALVCGCNGTTYSSECIADAVGVTVMNAGPCVPLQECGGVTRPACPEGQFCRHAEGVCAADAVGVCVDPPLACPVNVSEVCGCDRMTYLNACLAHAAGVTVSHAGACSTPG